MTTGDTILKLTDVHKHFPVTRGIVFRREIGRVKAVDGVSFEIKAGQTLGLVGESGCGKSTLARCVVRLLDPSSGSIEFQGVDITTMSGSALRQVRRDLVMIFQDPMSSLNPRMRVSEVIGEPLAIHQVGTSTTRRARVMELLELVGLSSEHYNRFPHEFSGGQRQRIGIARALALEPKLIVCDEPVSALDVSVQAQIINLLEDLQSEFGLTYLFIAHDLDVVHRVSDEVHVMYLGKVVERGTDEDLYGAPHHPYSVALLSARPEPDPEQARIKSRIILEGDVPSPLNPPEGCRFHTRCPRAQPVCSEVEPRLSGPEHSHDWACHYPVERWPLASPDDIRLATVASAVPPQAAP
jgi:oligopeptide/dipeptide ABC transporter ATP-binding protein